MSTVSLEMVVSLPQITSMVTTFMAMKNMIGYQRTSFPLSFMLPLSGREQPYGMRVVMMVSLHPTVSTYADNEMAIASPINPYLASSSAISNLGQIAQPTGGLGYIPLGMPYLTNNSL